MDQQSCWPRVEQPNLCFWCFQGGSGRDERDFWSGEGPSSNSSAKKITKRLSGQNRTGELIVQFQRAIGFPGLKPSPSVSNLTQPGPSGLLIGQGTNHIVRTLKPRIDMIQL